MGDGVRGADLARLTPPPRTWLGLSASPGLSPPRTRRVRPGSCPSSTPHPSIPHITPSLTSIHSPFHPPYINPSISLPSSPLSPPPLLPPSPLLGWGGDRFTTPKCKEQNRSPKNRSTRFQFLPLSFVNALPGLILASTLKYIHTYIHLLEKRKKKG